MANKVSKDFVVSSLRGGMNNQDPAHSLADDQCVLAENVEFFFSTLGERRNGCEVVDIADSGLDDEDVIVHLGTHLPFGSQVYQSELWAISATIGTSATLAHRATDQVTWTEITPVDPIITTLPAITHINSQSFNGKMYLAYYSTVDRLHVWDGTSLRPTGLTAPLAAPTAVDDAAAGAYVDDRIFRVRFIEKDGDVILRRSEPSDELTFTPSGVNDGAVVTRPAVVNEGETHWELEASDGDGNFYVIATVDIATTTYTDTTQPATDYATNGELSDSIGDDSLMPSVEFIKVDQDRLILARSWNDDEKASRVWWTPVLHDPGVGNSERIPDNTDNYIDLDNNVGGAITGLSDPVNGAFYVFKLTKIYKFQRTGRFDKAYEAFLMSSYRGAMPGSVISGVDEFGKGCIYFLDPSIGPMRVGAQGLQHIQNIRGTWRRFNGLAAYVSSHGVYYPDKHQVHWWLAVDGSDQPAIKIVLQTNEIRSSADGTERGWTLATGRIAEAWCSTTFPEVDYDEITGAPFLSYRPYIGLSSPDFIQKCDIGFTDADQSYRAKIISKPYILAGLLNKWGAMTAALLADPNDDPTIHVNVKFIRDFGKEENVTTTNFVPDGNENQVIKVLDNLAMSQSKAIQFEFEDP